MDVSARDQLLQDSITLITNATGLAYQAARTLILYTGLTYLLTQLDQCPIMVIKGPTETGKTTSMLIAQELVYNAEEIISQPTKAVLRDSMKENSTLFIEEADLIDEGLITNRYDKSNPLPINRSMGNGAFMRHSLHLFGATILHRRRPFIDPATESRCLTLYTTPKDTADIKRYTRGTILELRPLLKEWSSSFPFYAISSLPPGRAEYNWGLLRLFNLQLPSDPEWDLFVHDQMTQAKQTTLEGREEEPIAMVWSAIAQLCLISPPEGFNTPTAVKNRILLTDIGKAVEAEGISMNGWQIGHLARQMGFDVLRVRGHQWVYPRSVALIRQIGINLGIDDELCQNPLENQ